MARQRPADFLPAHVLARPDFGAACAARDLGAVLRLAKRWGGVGFSASHLARRCEMTVSRIQDYVNGRTQAQRVEIFERVADGLHIPGAMFDLATRAWEQNGQAPHVADATRSEPSIGDGELSVLRRDFMKLGAGLAASSLATGLPGLPSGASGNKIGATSVEALRTNFARLRQLDDQLGGGDTFRVYLAEVENLANLLKRGGFADPVQRDLQVLFAEQTQQAGWAAFDAGWQQKATSLFERSFEAAKEANAADLAGNALALRSYQLLSNRTLAPELTDKSLVIAADSVHPAVKSLLYQRGAWTYAVAGKVGQTAEALGRASEALAGSATAGPAPGWAAWAHNPLELQIMTGRCWSVLHRPIRAITALEAAMGEYDDSHARDKALYLSWLADAYVDAGEVEHAALVVGRALDLSTNIASSRPRERVAAVLGRLEPHKAATEVSELFVRCPLDPVEVRR